MKKPKESGSRAAIAFATVLAFLLGASLVFVIYEDITSDVKHTGEVTVTQAQYDLKYQFKSQFGNISVLRFKEPLNPHFFVGQQLTDIEYRDSGEFHTFVRAGESTSSPKEESSAGYDSHGILHAKDFSAYGDYYDTSVNGIVHIKKPKTKEKVVTREGHCYGWNDGQGGSLVCR